MAKKERKIWTDITPHPWRRYAARALDNGINGFIGVFILLIALLQISPAISDSVFSLKNRVFYIMLMIFMAIFVNAAFIRIFGNTLGKFIFGIKITKEDNGPLSYGFILKREFIVWYKGFAIGIPIIGLFTMVSEYKNLTEKGITSWDKKLNIKILYRDVKKTQKFLYVVGVILLLIIFKINLS